MLKSVENSAVEYLYSYLSGKDSTADFESTLTKAVATAKDLVTLATDANIAGITYAELVRSTHDYTMIIWQSTNADYFPCIALS